MSPLLPLSTPHHLHVPSKLQLYIIFLKEYSWYVRYQHILIQRCKSLFCFLYHLQFTYIVSITVAKVRFTPDTAPSSIQYDAKSWHTIGVNLIYLFSSSWSDTEIQRNGPGICWGFHSLPSSSGTFCEFTYLQSLPAWSCFATRWLGSIKHETMEKECDEWGISCQKASDDLSWRFKIEYTT